MADRKELRSAPPVPPPTVPARHESRPQRKVGIDFRLAYHRQAGITRYTHNLMQAMQAWQPEFRFTVFHHRKQPSARRYPQAWSHRTLFSPVHHAWEQQMLQWELQWPRLDLVHFPDFIGPYRTRLPTVITVHDLAWHYWPEILDDQARAYYGQLEQAVDHARQILVPSQHTRTDLEHLCPAAAAKTRVIQHAVDPAFLCQPRSASMVDRPGEQNLQLPAHYLLHVGTLEPRKNIPVLLQVFAQVRQRSSIPDLKLMLVGAQGWRQRDLPDLLAQRDLEAHCVFPGQIGERNLVQAYAQARCVLHPALYEGFGFPLLEGMASGTPVVASSASCLPEIGGDAVLYADPQDVDGLADQVLAILHNPDLARTMVTRGYRRVAEFSWSRTARQTLDAYRAAMDT